VVAVGSVVAVVRRVPAPPAFVPGVPLPGAVALLVLVAERELGMIGHRPAADHDRAFVVDSWIDSYRTAHTAGMIGMSRWRMVMWPEVERVLDRPGTETIVAYETTETDHVADLYGFICVDTSDEPPIVFYCYVKQPYRQSGVARSLFKAAGVDPDLHFVYACRTGMVARLRGKIPCAKFNPLSARFDTRR
jgi:hypothetical protein